MVWSCFLKGAFWEWIFCSDREKFINLIKILGKWILTGEILGKEVELVKIFVVILEIRIELFVSKTSFDGLGQN